MAVSDLAPWYRCWRRRSRDAESCQVIPCRYRARSQGCTTDRRARSDAVDADTVHLSLIREHSGETASSARPPVAGSSDQPERRLRSALLAGRNLPLNAYLFNVIDSLDRSRPPPEFCVSRQAAVPIVNGSKNKARGHPGFHFRDTGIMPTSIMGTAPSPPPIRVAILGAGNIGSTFAFQLARAGHHDLTVIPRPNSVRLR